MSRYIGPKCKLCRREGMKLFLKGARCETVKCAIAKRAHPPGEHPWTRKKRSEYGLQLREKQKAKRTYGIFERPFRNLFGRAARMTGSGRRWNACGSGRRRLRLPGRMTRKAGKALARLGTPWAQKREREVARVCYLELGRRILEVELPDMTFCKHKVRQVYEGARKYGFADPVMDALVARAAKQCS